MNAAEFLLSARRTATYGAMPHALRPRTEAEAYAIQANCMAALGPIGGWKVGASYPNSACTCAPLPMGGLLASPAVLQGDAFTSREIESEIAFVLGADLPARAAPYTREEVAAALASCHAGIEVLQSRFADPDNTDALSNLADLIRHGAYVLGPPIGPWRDIDFAALQVRQVIAGEAILRIGNPAGDMMRLVVWLANEGARWAGGLRAGQIVTCGSWTGKLAAPQGAAVCTQFGDLPGVELRFREIG